MSKDFSAEQIEALFSAMEQNPKLQSRMNALLAIKEEESSRPSPAVTSGATTSVSVTTNAPSDLNAGRTRSETNTLEQLDATPRQEVEGSSDLVALVKDLHLPRHIHHVDNAYVPDLTALFTMLHHCDDYLKDLFKARRACLTFSPIHNRIYFMVLVHIQVARCMHRCNYFDSDADSQSLASFLNSYPPEKLHIPGPLLPFFKSLTTYKVQNELHHRVSPRFPEGLNETTVNKGSFVYTNSAFGYLPLVLAILCKQAEALRTIDPKKYLDNALFKAPYIFEYKSSTDSSEYKNNVSIAGLSFAKEYSTWTAGTAAWLSPPALRHELELNEDVVTNIKTYGATYKLPEVDDAYAPKNFADFTLISKKKWFASFLRPMASYASLFEGSGTLADCSVDGPASGAYVFNYATSETAPVNPKYPFDPLAVFDLNGTIYSTQGSPEPVAERLAVATRIHTRPATDHPLASAYYTAAHRRFGTVWNQAPVYGPSSIDYLYDSIEEVVPKFVRKQLSS